MNRYVINNLATQDLNQIADYFLAIAYLSISLYYFKLAIILLTS